MMVVAANNNARCCLCAESPQRLVVVALFFVAPLAMSLVEAFRAKEGGFTLQHFSKAFEFYGTDLLFTLAIVALSTVLIGVVAIAIAGYLTLGANPRAVAILRWLYRWPLFIPFVVAGQVMRTFLAKNGMLNHVLIGSGTDRAVVGAKPARLARHRHRLRVEAGAVRHACCWPAQWRRSRRSISKRRATSARRGCACSIDIVLPQVRGTLLVGLVLSFVTMLSVLSVPLMINPNSPTMMTVDIAYGSAARRLRRRQRAVPDVAGAGGHRRGVLSAARFTHAGECGSHARPRHAGDPGAAILRAVLLGLFAFAIFGPLFNLMLWAFAERWYFPSKLPLEYGLTYWYRVFQPRGNALASLGTSVWIALLTVVFGLAVGVPAGYALARLKLPWRGAILLLFLLPQAVPNLPVYVNIAQVFYQIGLNGTVLGVVLVHASHGLVLAVWIASAAFASVDVSLEEASRNLGARRGRAFGR